MRMRAKDKRSRAHDRAAGTTVLTLLPYHPTIQSPGDTPSIWLDIPPLGYWVGFFPLAKPTSQAH